MSAQPRDAVGYELSAEDIGRVLKLWRDQRGLSLAGLERETGIGHSMLHRYERGERSIPLAETLKLCTFHGRRVEELLEQASTMRVSLNPRSGLVLLA